MDYNEKIYKKARSELSAVNWNGCPYDIKGEMTNLMLRYYPDEDIEVVRHAVNWAVADEINGGCELEEV